MTGAPQAANSAAKMAELGVAENLVLYGVNPTGEEIGRGAYGRVFEVDYEGTFCAAKEIHSLLLQYSRDDDVSKIKEIFLRECQIWSVLRHPFVVQFLGEFFFPTLDMMPMLNYNSTDLGLILAGAGSMGEFRYLYKANEYPGITLVMSDLLTMNS